MVKNSVMAAQSRHLKSTVVTVGTTDGSFVRPYNLPTKSNINILSLVTTFDTLFSTVHYTAKRFRHSINVQWG